MSTAEKGGGLFSEGYGTCSCWWESNFGGQTSNYHCKNIGGFNFGGLVDFNLAVAKADYQIFWQCGTSSQHNNHAVNSDKIHKLNKVLSCKTLGALASYPAYNAV